jgi:hypothetical protein
MVFPSFCQNKKNELFMVCGDSKVLLVDYNLSKGTIPEVVWTWDAHEAMDLPEEYRLKKFNSMDDIKSIKNGKEILVSSSSGAVAVLSKKNKKVLFYASVPNAHSIEILPNNRLVAAASTAKEGNKIMLFDLNLQDQPVFTDSLYSAHGVVWDEQRKSLFALGYDVLREYKMVGKDSLSLTNEWKIPGESGHDLFPSPDGNHLYMTEHTGVWMFDLQTHKFGKIPGFPEAENIKSIGKNPAGQFIYTVPEESWWTFHVSFFEPQRSLAFPGMKVYKARWFNP